MRLGLTTGSLSRHAGGLFESVRALAKALTEREVNVRVYGLWDKHWELDKKNWLPLEAEAFSYIGPRAAAWSPQMDAALDQAESDLIHLHGLWQYPSVATRRQWKTRRTPYLISPRGMLDAWALANSRWKKVAAAWLFEKAVLRDAACLHALCDSEAAAMRNYGLKNRIEIIPNGVNLPGLGNAGSRRADKPSGGRRQLLFLGRIHPKKGLVRALRAWAGIQNPKSKIHHSKQWQFVIAGWDQGGHEAELRALCADLGLRTAVATTKDTNQHENIEPRITRMGTDDTKAQGGAWASQAGASFSNPSTSELARDSENTSPTRSANGPAEAMRAETREMGSAGENRLADSKEFLDAQLQAGLQVDNQKGHTIRTANDPSASGEYSSSVSIREIRGQNASSPATSYSLPATAPKALALDAADVVFVGPAYGADKEALLQSVHAFILPSLSEGLPMSVLEAWAAGLPVVMTPECNLPEGFACRAALEIRNDEDSFRQGLQTLLEMTDGELVAMGLCGRRLVEEKFTWSNVAAQLHRLYADVMER